MKSRLKKFSWLGIFLMMLMMPRPVRLSAVQQTQKKPNILFIMGDDVGWFNISAYHQGMMSGRTPNLDKLASQGMRLTDYYAEASCTAGRANFITGQIPLRTGLTTVAQAGADVGIPAQARTLATALKAQVYATGQFGKNRRSAYARGAPACFRCPVTDATPYALARLDGHTGIIRAALRPCPGSGSHVTCQQGSLDRSQRPSLPPTDI